VSQADGTDHVSHLDIRPATAGDVPAIVAMLADDALGATREDQHDLAPYLTAFERISGDPQQLLVFAELDGQPAGTLQLTFIQGLSRRGATRALIESVRIDKRWRGEGLGTQLVEWAIARARGKGATVVQLTSDASRTDAHRFYERLGFVHSHAGFKLPLERRERPGKPGKPADQ
jgi:GNAT superfamily N-acetyltransferase